VSRTAPRRFRRSHIVYRVSLVGAAAILIWYYNAWIIHLAVRDGPDPILFAATALTAALVPAGPVLLRRYENDWWQLGAIVTVVLPYAVAVAGLANTGTSVVPVPDWVALLLAYASIAISVVFTVIEAIADPRRTWVWGEADWGAEEVSR